MRPAAGSVRIGILFLVTGSRRQIRCFLLGWQEVLTRGVILKSENKLLMRKQYKLLDYLSILFMLYPLGTLILILNKLLAALLPALQVVVIAGIIDNITQISTGSYEQDRMIFLLARLLCLSVFSYLNGSIASCFTLKMEIRIGKEYTTALMEKTASLKYQNIENESSHNLIERTCKEPITKIMSGFNRLSEMGELIIRVISLLAILSLQVWWVGLVIVIVAVPLFKLSLKAGKENYDAVRDAEKYEREAKDYQKVLTGRDSVEERTLYGYSEAVNLKWHKKHDAARKITLRVILKNFIKMKVSSLITVAISLLIIGVLLFPLAQGNITLGLFIALVSASFSLIQLMSWQLAWLTEQIANGREYMKDLTEFFLLPEEENVLERSSGDPVSVETIEFNHVSFQYPNTERYILKNFSLKMQKGKHYAIVGINGAGKTTITKLLTGLYNEYEGEILVNGKNIKDYSKRTLMDMFSIVHQDFARYQISLSDNIKIGKPSWEKPQRLTEVLQLSGMEEVVAELPKGILTNLGKIEKGAVDVSGGQWQRIAIARALYNPASVRVLDEPTAALDPVSESNIYKMFGEISKDVTTVFITHRMGAARLADVIIVINDGRASEVGSHEELLGKHGIYAEMFETQRAWYK
jgi:ATP-binding cassette subfamily B protein